MTLSSLAREGTCPRSSPLAAAAALSLILSHQQLCLCALEQRAELLLCFHFRPFLQFHHRMNIETQTSLPVNHLCTAEISGHLFTWLEISAGDLQLLKWCLFLYASEWTTERSVRGGWNRAERPCRAKMAAALFPLHLATEALTLIVQMKVG